jgi:acetyltransferase-like isoleucine patch superfamily enzyme
MINMILKLIKSLLINVIHAVKRFYKTFLLSHHHPTCRFDASSKIVDCEFEENVVVFDHCKLFASKIGAYSYIQMGSRVFNCEIGKFCSIAGSVSIAPGMHDMNRVSTHPSFFSFTEALPKVFVTEDKFPTSQKVLIGHDVWIGEKATILDGVKIGNGAVIASGAVVIKDVAPYSVVGGVPARHLKYRFDEKTISLLLQSEWWNNSDDWFQQNAVRMLDPKIFIESQR